MGNRIHPAASSWLGVGGEVSLEWEGLVPPGGHHCQAAPGTGMRPGLGVRAACPVHLGSWQQPHGPS